MENMERVWKEKLSELQNPAFSPTNARFNLWFNKMMELLWIYIDTTAQIGPLSALPYGSGT